MSKKILIGVICIIGLAVAISFGGQVPLKPFRDSGMVIDTHGKNNLGQLYQVSYSSHAVKEAQNLTFLIDLAQVSFTGSRVHAKIKTAAESNTEVRFYETPVVTSSGTPIIGYNRNRELATAPETLFYHHPIVTSSGTLLSTSIISDHISIEPPIIQEWILPDDGVYLIEMLDMINGTAGNDMSVAIEFFETE